MKHYENFRPRSKIFRETLQNDVTDEEVRVRSIENDIFEQVRKFSDIAGESHKLQDIGWNKCYELAELAFKFPNELRGSESHEKWRYFFSKSMQYIFSIRGKKFNSWNFMHAYAQYCSLLRADFKNSIHQEIADEARKELGFLLMSVPRWTDQELDMFGRRVKDALRPYAELGNIGQSVKFMRNITRSQISFCREDVDAPNNIFVYADIAKKLPDDFFQNPSQFIEGLPCLKRNSILDQIYSIGNLASLPYDISKIRNYKNFVFKRVDLRKVNFATEEIEIAENIRSRLEQIGVLHTIDVQTFVGFIASRGNFYLVSKLLDAIEMQNDDDAIDEIRQMIGDMHVDLAARNIMVSNSDKKPRYTLIDFETKPTPA